MPTQLQAVLTEADAEAWIARTCFGSGPVGRIGVELEFLVGGGGSVPLSRHYPRARYPALLDALSQPGLDGRLEVEPGGQVELSSTPRDTLSEAIGVVHRDLELLRRRARASEAVLVGLGLDPRREPRLMADAPRYLAMAEYFGQRGDTGRRMMSSTASIQVNVEAATASQTADDRCDLIHAIGPAMVAAFANSPIKDGRPTGWKSTRQAIWQNLDPARTGTPPRRPEEGITQAYARWALDTPVMMIRNGAAGWSIPHGLTFRDWLQRGDSAGTRGRPTVDDLAYHLTTLFPHVRARGHLEIRYLDALPGCWWIVPTAVIAALMDDPRSSDIAKDLCQATKGQWVRAAREGVAERQMRTAAQGLLSLAADRLTRNPGTKIFADHIGAYLERWTVRGRSPADDVVDQGTCAHIPDRCALDATVTNLCVSECNEPCGPIRHDR